MGSMTLVIQMMVAIMMMMLVADGADNNKIFSPCSDARVQRLDGFTFGLAFSSRESFTFNNTQLSPCDQRLALQSKQSQLSLFRPKVDQISLLTINSSLFDPVCSSCVTWKIFYDFFSYEILWITCELYFIQWVRIRFLNWLFMVFLHLFLSSPLLGMALGHTWYHTYYICTPDVEVIDELICLNHTTEVFHIWNCRHHWSTQFKPF